MALVFLLVALDAQGFKVGAVAVEGVSVPVVQVVRRSRVAPLADRVFANPVKAGLLVFVPVAAFSCGQPLGRDI